MDLVPYIFHEQQEGNLCAQHCLNALLQGPYFTAIDLAELARQLDQKEQDALGNLGSESRNATSQNMDDSGFFSVQVLSHALSIWNAQIIPWGAMEVSDAKSEPEREVAFICNLNEHWYTLRRFGPSTQRWYDLNSMLPRPRHMSATYLGMTLSQLEAEGYSIFVVRTLATCESTTTSSEISTEKAEDSAVKASTLQEEIKPTVVAPSSSASATPPTFLTERQEMERIRRQRIEERERAAQQQSVPAPPVITSSPAPEINASNKRTRVDHAGDNLEKDTKRASKDVLVSAPSFLPRCESDEMATVMPLENAQESDAPKEQTFGGAGYRLGGSPPPSTNESTSLPDGFSLEDTDFGGGEDGEGDAEWEMMQQAIAMSLQGTK